MSGFVGTAGLTVGLVAAAVGGTGAYFTDSDAGSLSGTSGNIDITAENSHINFTGLMPGTDQKAKIGYRIDSSAPSDVWMVFDVTTPANAIAYAAFTGAPDSTVKLGGGLGAFGHFAVSNNGGDPLFESYNLSDPRADSDDTCEVTSEGTGGSALKPLADGKTVSYCGVPAAIKVASNVKPGVNGYVGITFGLTGKASGYENAQWANVPFNITATQVGVRPDAKNF